MRLMRRRRKKKRTNLMVVVRLIGIFLGTLVVQGVKLNANCKKLATEQQQLKEQKADLEQEQKDIQKKKDYMQTNQYIEDIAREKFGLVYGDEIIFKAEDD